VDTSNLIHKKIDSEKTVQYRSDGNLWILGTMEGSFTTRFYLPGHGSTTAGSVTESALETLLGIIFGNADQIATGSTLTGGTANQPTTTGSGTLDAGDLSFIGALGDGDGGGQCYAVASHSTNTLTMLTDLADSPTNGAVRSSGTLIYPNTSP